MKEEVAFVFTPPFQDPGVYWRNRWYVEDGNPFPTKFYEAPWHAEMVKQGKSAPGATEPLPPLEDRMVHPEDIYVLAGPDELGVYGGHSRITTERSYVWLGWWVTGGMGTMYTMDNDLMKWWPNGVKEVVISEDGTTYTATLRRNHSWSDGNPVLMRDVEFAWELNFDKELNPKPFDKLTDPVTGNVPKFVVVDDRTWQLVFDTAHWAVIEGAAMRGRIDCNAMYGCHISPFHAFKEYHPKYADPAAFKKLMDEGGYENWTQVWKGSKPNSIDQIGIGIGQFTISEVGENHRKLSPNPYFHGFAPDGAQLPYLAGLGIYKTESREVAVFRTLAGETDGPSTGDFRPDELPMYLQNMEKGDYSVGFYPDNTGNDAGTQFNYEYNVDPEIGRAIRTKDFRIALSMAIDRDAMNEIVFGGLGVPQAWVPHRSHPFYPGDKWQQMYAKQDLKAAGAILDKLGYIDTDGDGFRNRIGDLTGDTGNLVLYQEVYEYMSSAHEMEEKNWKELGIKYEWKEANNSGFWDSTLYLRTRQMPIMANPWYWHQMFPNGCRGVGMPMVGCHYWRGGKEGMAPVGSPQPTECGQCPEAIMQGENPYLPLAPKGNYPPDPDGTTFRLMDLHRTGRGYPTFHPSRIEIAQNLWKVMTEDVQQMGSVGFTGNARGIPIKRNNMRNVPDKCVYCYYGGYPGVWTFEGGIDNINNPGNRSKLYRSTSFIECPHFNSANC